MGVGPADIVLSSSLSFLTLFSHSFFSLHRDRSDPHSLLYSPKASAVLGRSSRSRAPRRPAAATLPHARSSSPRSPCLAPLGRAAALSPSPMAAHLYQWRNHSSPQDWVFSRRASRRLALAGTASSTLAFVAPRTVFRPSPARPAGTRVYAFARRAPPLPRRRPGRWSAAAPAPVAGPGPVSGAAPGPAHVRRGSKPAGPPPVRRIAKDATELSPYARGRWVWPLHSVQGGRQGGLASPRAGRPSTLQVFTSLALQNP